MRYVKFYKPTKWALPKPDQSVKASSRVKIIGIAAKTRKKKKYGLKAA